LTVALDGTGDYAKLEEALVDARSGAVIRLSGGLHRLSRPLDISLPVKLQGDGRNTTVIVGDGEGYVMRFLGKGTFELHDLAVEHQGVRWARVVIVEQGTVDFRGIKVSGGVRDQAGKRGGEGLLLQGDVDGMVTASEFTGNQLHGIKLAGKARPSIEGCTCRANGKVGIAWFDDAGGVARGNSCSSNGQYGLAVVDKAAPRLIGNVCADNRRGGLFLESGKTSGVSDNRCDLFRGKK